MLYTLRQQLRTDFTATHDWASIVAYAVVPWDFEKQLDDFRNRQTKQRIEVQFDEAEQCLRAYTLSGSADSQPNPALHDKLENIYGVIRQELQKWCDSAPKDAPNEQANRLGMSAASEKRIGNLFHSLNQQDKAKAAYQKACELYKRGFEAYPVNHWVVTQYLSMIAVLRQSELVADYGSWWKATRQVAEWQLRDARGEERAWALGTLLELELLGVVYAGSEFNEAAAKGRIAQFCRELRDVAGRDSFPVFSTRRQFFRYRNTWSNESWNGLAEYAMECLPDSQALPAKAQAATQT